MFPKTGAMIGAWIGAVMSEPRGGMGGWYNMVFDDKYTLSSIDTI